MKSSVQKELCLAITAGVGLLSALPAAAHSGSSSHDHTITDPDGNYSTTHKSATQIDSTVDKSSTKYTYHGQTSDSFFDELIDGSNRHTDDRTAYGRTETVTDGTNTTTYKHRSTGFEFDGDTTIAEGRQLTVKGKTKTKTLEVDGDATVGNDLAVTRDATVGRDLKVNRNAHIAGNAQVDGMTTLNGGLTVANGTTVNMGGNRVQNVADGVADTDAVNARQLNTTNTNLSNHIASTNIRFTEVNARVDATNTVLNEHIANTGARFDQVNGRINKLDKRIDETGAIAAAFAQLGEAQTPGKSTFGIAAGTQGGKTGVALGFSRRLCNKPVVIKASVGSAGHTTSAGVGATFEF